MARMGPRMGPRQGPRQGPGQLVTNPLAGYVSTFTTDVGNDDSTILLATVGEADISCPGPFRLSTTGTLPDGYATDTDYWITAAPGPFGEGGLATSRADALANTRVHFVDDGTGTHTITYTG